MSEADYNHPEVGALIDRWLVGPNTTGHRRMLLMKLAWDMTGTEFGSRAGLYERLYSGDPERNGNWFAHPITRECESLVERGQRSLAGRHAPVAHGAGRLSPQAARPSSGPACAARGWRRRHRA